MNKIRRNKRAGAAAKGADEKDSKKTTGGAADSYKAMEKPAGVTGSFTE